MRFLERRKVFSKRAKTVLLLAALLLPVRGAAAQEIIRRGDILDLDKCIRFALEHLPALQAARAGAEAEKSLIRQAESAYYPQVEWTSSIGRSSVGPRSSLGIRTGAVTYNSYSTGVSLSQNVFDFGKTPTQVKIQKLNYSASVSDIATASQEAIFNVKQGYYGVLAAKRSRDVADEAVRQYQLHLDQARGLFEVGLQPKYDVTKAAVDLGNARVNLIKARNAVQLALAALNNAMGLTGTIDYDIEDNLSFEPSAISLEDALAEAFKNRPELAALAAKRQAAESSISLARKGFLPTLGGTASYDYSGNAFPLPRGWNLALSLNLSLFNGFQTTAQVAQAQANLNVLRANEEAERQVVYLAVQQAYLSLKQAEELVPVAELNVTAAQENFDIANGSYQEGVGDPIQVADAGAALVSAKMAHIQALYDCKIARASLELAMGLK